MRERLQRRKKKKDAEQTSQPVPPPLQPAYFEAEAPRPPAAEPTPVPERPSVSEEPESSPARDSQESAEQRTDSASPDARPGAFDRSRRGRRRRGGRGRGPRVREQAVAQAFTPSGLKGAIPSPVAEEPIESPEAEAAAAPMVEVPKIPAAPPAPQRPPKGIVVLAIGLPGSGKSTWFKRHNVVPLSSDMVRTLLFDDVREQRFQDLVFSNLRSMLKARLIAKRPTNYVDATNLTPQERQHWIKLAKDYGYEVHAVFFDVPLEVCIERHSRRDRVVPEDVMRRMAAKLKAPNFSEGFAKITVVRVKKKE